MTNVKNLDSVAREENTVSSEWNMGDVFKIFGSGI